MPARLRFGLPSARDWAWMLALVALGAVLGFAMNATSGKGINLRIALNLDHPQASGTAGTQEELP